MNFKEYKINDICKLINGRAYLMPELQHSGKYRIVRVGNFSGRDEWFYSDLELDNDKYCEKGDLLFKWACNFGPEIWDQEKVIYHYHIWKIICDESKVSKLYFFYYLKYFTPNLLGSTNGTTMVHITKESMERKKILIPIDPKTQQKIADILSKYDDLIENNNKRIKLLEQMAENLYKNIFSLKKIKNTSKLIRLEEIINITRGLSYSSEEIECEEGIDLINLKNIKSFGGFRLDGTKKYNGKYKEEQVVKTGDLIMGVTDMTQDRRTVGYVALIPILKNISVISADLIKINSQVDNVYLYCMFRYGQISKYISQFANGANVLHLKPKSVMNIKVYLPKQEKINYFVNIVKPIIQEIDLLNEQIGSLIKQRDLLLPRLMSGKLKV